MIIIAILIAALLAAVAYRVFHVGRVPMAAHRIRANVITDLPASHGAATSAPPTRSSDASHAAKTANAPAAPRSHDTATAPHPLSNQGSAANVPPTTSENHFDIRSPDPVARQFDTAQAGYEESAAVEHGGAFKPSGQPSDVVLATPQSDPAAKAARESHFDPPGLPVGPPAVDASPPIDDHRGSRLAAPRIAKHGATEPLRSDRGTRSHWTEMREGDTYWTVAQRHYGDGRWFRALYEHNRRRIDEFEPEPGRWIELPRLDDLIRQWPALVPDGSTSDRRDNRVTSDSNAAADGGRLYITRDGDTLFEIARTELGQASRYVELWRANRDRLPSGVDEATRLAPGIRLTLPAR